MTKGTIIRTVVLFIALLNQALVIAGYSPLPFDSAEVEQFVTLVATIAASIAAWWKDNDITKKAQARKASVKQAEQQVNITE